MARFFAAGHGEFAASVPGGHTDIFREKNKFLFPYVFYSIIYTAFFLSFPVSFIFSLSFFFVLV